MFSFAEDSIYKTYENEKYGVSFEYPASAKIESSDNKEKLNVWFQVEQLPTSGVLFDSKGTGNFNQFIEAERKDQETYKKEMSEEEYPLSESTNGFLFIREAKPINSKIYYFVFPTLKTNTILSLWHKENTSTGFMGNPEKETKAVREFKRMIKTLKLSK